MRLYLYILGLLYLLYTSTALGECNLLLRERAVPVPEVFVNSVTPIDYILTNRSTKPVSFQVNSQPKNFYLDQIYSTCGNRLGAHQSCQLKMRLSSPKVRTTLKTNLTVTLENKESVSHQLDYQVIDKNKPLINLNNSDLSYHWQAITSLVGGNIVSVSPSFNNPNLLYAVSWYGDVYQSTDNGESWSVLSDFFNDIGASQLVDTNKALYCQTLSSGVFKSTDNGANWQDFSDGLNIDPNKSRFDVINGLIQNNNMLYVAPTTGVFTRNPVDQTWASLNPPKKLFADTLMFANNVLYAGNYNFNPAVPGVYALPDGSKNWMPLGLNGMLVQTFLNDEDNRVIYAGINNFNFTPQAIFKSVDYGKTWMNATNQIGYSRVMQLTKSNNAVYAATQRGKDADLKLSGGGVFKSTDNGSNWQSMNNGVPYLNTQNILAVGKNLFLSTTGGVYKSFDGGNNWISANQGILERHVRNINVLDDGSLYINSFSGDLFKSQDNGQTWNAQNNGLDINNESGDLAKTVIQSNQGIIYLAEYRGVYQSIDNGASWINIDNNLNGSDGENQILGLIVSDNNTLYLGGDTTVFVSKDGGNSWDSISNDILPSVDHMLISYHELYVSSDGDIYKHSLDGKAKWKWINHNLPNPHPSRLHIYGIAKLIDNDNIARVYLATNAGVYFSQNGGENWLAANNGLPMGVVVTSIIASDSHLIIGTANHGVFYSTDAGLNWQSGGNLPAPGFIMNLGANKDYVFAAGSRGLFKINAQELGF